MPSELLVPRKGITYKTLEEGRFIPISDDVPEILRTPMVRGQGGSILGHESGYRSGLIQIDGQLYKLKGCRPEEGHRKDIFGAPIPGPLGTQILGLAQFEADNTLKRREYFLSQGWEYPIEPVGFWAYDHFKFDGQPTGATIYRVKGDARLDEFIWHLERAPLAFAPGFEDVASENLFRIGIRTGQALKTFHNGKFAWDWNEEKERRFFNAHHGNVIIFPDTLGNAEIGLVDFDNSIKADKPSEASELKLVQEGDLNLLIRTLANTVTVSTPEPKDRSLDVPSDIIERLFARACPQLNEHYRGIAGGRLLTNLGFEETGLLANYARIAARQGYNLEAQGSSDLKWEELASLSRRVGYLRQSFRLRVLQELGGDITKEKIVQLATVSDQGLY